MLTKFKNSRASATVEYSMVIIAFLMALFVMQTYIFRGIAGKWRNVGDSFGSGRQYDPVKTKECVLDTEYGLSVYYDAPCMRSFNCPDPKSQRGRRCMAAAVSACTADCN